METIPTPEQQTDHTRRDVVILLSIIAALCCLAVLIAGAGYFLYEQYTETQIISGTATSAYMATKIKQDTDTQATLQVQASATARVLEAQATATAQAQQAQATATAQALQARAQATSQAKSISIQAYTYFDPFDDNQNEWRLQEEENEFWLGRTNIENGVYTWQIDEVLETFVAWADFSAETTFKDFDAAVLVRRQQGEPENTCGGLLFRKSPDGFGAGSYSFSVCDHGYFSVNYYDDEVGWETILDWTETTTTIQGDWNLLEISARGTKFDLFINGQKVGEFSDDRLPEGYLSIYVDTYEKTPAIIEFDNFGVQTR